MISYFRIFSIMSLAIKNRLQFIEHVINILVSALVFFIHPKNVLNLKKKR